MAFHSWPRGGQLHRALILSLLFHGLLLVPEVSSRLTVGGGARTEVRAVLLATSMPPSVNALPVPVSAAKAVRSTVGLSTPKLPVPASVAAMSEANTQGVRASVGERGDGDVQALIAYRLALAGAARRLRRSEASSVDRSGSVGLQIELAKWGAASRVQITASSGDDELDHVALALVERAARQVEVPPSLHGGQAVPLTIRFGE